MLKKLTALWAIYYLAAQIVFPILAICLMALSANNWHKLAYGHDSQFRVYFSLPVGTMLYAKPYAGREPLYILTGEALVEQKDIKYSQGSETNPQLGRSDPDSQHKVCLRLATTTADALAFATNYGCMWLRNPGGEKFIPITGPVRLRTEWTRLEDVAKQNGVIHEYAYAYLSAILSSWPWVMIFTFVTYVLALFLRRGRSGSGSTLRTSNAFA